MAKKASWPKIKFSGCGKKPSSELLRRVDPFRGVDYFDFLQHWNGGTPTDGSFKVLGVDGNPTLAEVKYFFGVTVDCGPSDIRSAVYRYWDYLPRGALPIAEVEIEDEEYDQCLLITFRWGEKSNQVFLLANPHECAGDPDDVRDLQKLASSLPQFLASLQSWQYYTYRAWYQLPVPADQLKSVADKLLECGCVDHYQHFEDIQDRKCSLAYHAEIGFGIWLAHPKEKIRQVPAPKVVPSDMSILAIDAPRWNHAAAEKSVRKALQSLKIKQLVKLGETRVADSRGPFDPSLV